MSLNIKGVDVSYCQKGLDYNKLKAAGVKFAIIRAGAKLSADSLLQYHVNGCKSIGIDYGFYWYCYATDADGAVKEAKKCLEVISKYDRPTYPVFFDMEENSQAKLGRQVCTEMAQKFCETIENGGYPAGVYANPAWLESFYYKAKLVGTYDIWLAHWTENPARPSSYNYGQTMHQWGLDNTGSSSCLGMKIDGDICYIDYPAKTADWYEKHGIAIEDNKVPLAPASAPVETDKQPEMPTNTSVLHKGDRVILRNAPLFAASASDKKANTLSGEYFVHSDGVINGRIRITTKKGNSVCTGWVDVSQCVTSTARAFAVGDTVIVRHGAKTYDGGNLASFVYSQKYTVMQVGTRGAADYIVIGKGGVVTAALHADDLILI